MSSHSHIAHTLNSVTCNTALAFRAPLHQADQAFHALLAKGDGGANVAAVVPSGGPSPISSKKREVAFA